jgi:hypothetical protein
MAEKTWAVDSALNCAPSEEFFTVGTVGANWSIRVSPSTSDVFLASDEEIY